MSMELTPEQQGLKAKICTGAILWGMITGLIVALLTFWLGSNAPDWVRWGFTILLGAGAGFLTYRMNYNSGVAKAVCRKCGIAFGIREIARNEQIVGSEQRQKLTPAKAASKTDRGTNKLTTWTEVKVEVTAIDECFNCQNRTERKWQSSRDTDKVETEVPA